MEFCRAARMDRRRRVVKRAHPRHGAPTHLRLRIEQLEPRQMLAFSVLGAQATMGEGPTLVADGSAWHFLDDGSDQDTAWRDPGFDDATWPSGPAQLGYGDDDEATTLQFGVDPDNKFITTYFRHTFQVADPASIDALKLSVIRDDGVAVYLNGVEILRDGLATDAAFDDVATQTISSAEETTPVITSLSVDSLPPGTLLAGANVLAAEIHQVSLTSSDISFDLSLQVVDVLHFVVDLGGPVDPATLDAADLLVDGNPTATEAVLVDAETVRFALPNLSAGAHTLAIDAGSILSAGSEPVETFSQTLTIAADNQYLMKQTPRLQPGNAPLSGFAGGDFDQVDILWQTVPDGAGTEDSFEVEYRLAASANPWTAAGAVTQEPTDDGGRVMHLSTILGLEWDTDYEYRMIHRRADVIVNTYQRTFHSRLQAGDAQPFTFVAYGDSAADGAVDFRPVQARINQMDPAFSMLLGDNIYYYGTHDEADARFDPTVNPEAAEWVAGHIDYLGLGNHDVRTDEGAPSELLFSVPVPEADVNAHAAPPAGERDEHSFSWDYGDVHFVTFDTNSLHDGTRLDGLLDYVVADLEASDARWKIVYGHHPVAGSPDKAESPRDYYYQQVVSRLVGAGADLLLVGHSHMYHWTYPLTGQTNGVAEFVPGPYNAFETNQGLPQLVSGVSGASLRSGDFSPYPFTARGFSQTTAIKSDWGFTQVDVTPSQLKLSYIAADNGDLIDSFTITAVPDTAAPTARLISPVDNGPVDLNTAEGGILLHTAQNTFEIGLRDIGDGIDDATVTSGTVALVKDGVELTSPADYTFAYQSATNRITLTSSAGGFSDGVYSLALNGGAARIADLAGNALSGVAFQIEIDTSLPGPQTGTFQQGADGYAGTVDTFLAEDDPTADHSAATSLEIDQVNVDGPSQGLLRFDGIFGPGAGQIPPNATILSAVLELEVTNEGDSIALYRMLQPFSDTDTWDSHGGGIQADGLEALPTPDATTGGIGVGTLSVNLKASLTAWLADPSSNRGWALLPTGENGVDLDSTEGADPPRLIVTYTTPERLSVVAMEETAGGAAVRLSRPLDVDQLNLYGGSSRGQVPPDVTLAGDQVGPVAGSLVWQPATNSLRFVKTGQPLAPDTYTLTLESRPDGIVDLAGQLLDGDADGTPGGNFVTQFTVTAAQPRTLRIPDIVRGPRQAVDLESSGGIPLSIDDASGVTDIAVTFDYDPAVLTVSGGGPAPGLPLDWQVVVDSSTPGSAVITAQGSALPAAPLDLVVLTADVSTAAPYGESRVFLLAGVSLNGGALAARGDEALFSATYFGDVTGNLGYSGLDASYIARVGVGLDNGFDYFPATDPILVGDTTGNGGLSGLDASYVARKAVGLPQDEIPDIPAPQPSRAVVEAPSPPADSATGEPSRAALEVVVDSFNATPEEPPNSSFGDTPSFTYLPTIEVPAAVRWQPTAESAFLHVARFLVEDRKLNGLELPTTEPVSSVATIRDRLFASLDDWTDDDQLRDFSALRPQMFRSSSIESSTTS
jgi:hypothetical protein